jgi:glycerate dehydrogenase
MKIVVLDGHTLNPGDLDWSGFEGLGDFTAYPRTSPEQLIPRAQGAGAILLNKVPLRAEALRALPDLRYVGVLATGYNVVDVEAAV